MRLTTTQTASKISSANHNKLHAQLSTRTRRIPVHACHAHMNAPCVHWILVLPCSLACSFYSAAKTHSPRLPPAASAPAHDTSPPSATRSPHMPPHQLQHAPHVPHRHSHPHHSRGAYKFFHNFIKENVAKVHQCCYDIEKSNTFRIAHSYSHRALHAKEVWLWKAKKNLHSRVVDS